MTRALRIRWWLLAALACGVVAAPRPLFAQARPRTPSAAPAAAPADPAPPGEPKTTEQLEAQQHFQRAKDLYQNGSYREAIAELELARGLDPAAKDLVFNLGIVHEKLGMFDEAIALFRQYIEMETVTAAERAKAETIITRIEGAKHEVPIPTAKPNAGNASPVAAPVAPRRDTRPGRIDAATITAGSVAVVGLGAGAVFGILAMTNKPGANEFTTGRDGSYDALKAKTDDAHTQAIVADVGFGVGIVATLVTAYLYFGRTREPKRTGLLHVVPSAAPVRSGGVMMLGGTFR